MNINAQYNLAAPESLAIRIAAYQRRRMFERFMAFTEIDEQNTVLDVGVTSDRSYGHSNYFEALYPFKHRITACGVDDASFLEEMYPGLHFVRADGRDLPFVDKQFDYVHSSAVLEHVGNKEMQVAFLRQAWRVARKGVFMTTPNRWFPVEFHTLMPFAHWLPRPAFEKICRMRGLDFFASEHNLNLVTAGQLRRLAERAGLQSYKVMNITLVGWPSNLLLSGKRAL